LKNEWGECKVGEKKKKGSGDDATARPGNQVIPRKRKKRILISWINCSK